MSESADRSDDPPGSDVEAVGPELDDESGPDEPVSDGLDDDEPVPAVPPVPQAVERGETLFYEEGGSRWIILIGPVMLALTFGLEIAGGGRIHWEVLLIFGVILIGFSIMQVVAARRHVSMRLTDQTLRQGTKIIDLDDIVVVYPENNSSEHREWESAPALGELHAVPRRRKGVGVKLSNGRLAQAWARDVDRFRTELTEAHLAVKMGLGPMGSSKDE
ncbi:DUF3093 domain-containing protein [Gordonia humi]|uniref:DUF3093 domain-containing protein n=1 Tax=Gordonia humi TaxID=686429 RepID=A0A840F2R5_9ACTN|nr:hypothetical protein [Gordonia humi]